MPGTVITYGTFDMFHVGHLRLLKRMAELGERTIVGVSTDAFNERKGKKALIPFEERKEIIESLRFVDLVIPEEGWNQKVSDIQLYGVQTFVMGDDWQGRFDSLKPYCEVVYLERTSGVSSTELRGSLSRLLSSEKEISDVLGLLRSLQRELD